MERRVSVGELVFEVTPCSANGAGLLFQVVVMSRKKVLTAAELVSKAGKVGGRVRAQNLIAKERQVIARQGQGQEGLTLTHRDLSRHTDLLKQTDVHALHNDTNITPCH